MLRSMTAYGCSTKDTSIGRLAVEIQSVNKKYLDINVSLPRELVRFDAEVKKWITDAVGRGQITAKYYIAFNQNIPLAVSANLPLALKIQQASQELASALGFVSNEKLTLHFLMQQPNILSFDEQMEDEDLYREALREVFDSAMPMFLDMKTREGKLIFMDIEQKLETLQQAIKLIAQYAPNATRRYRERLSQRLKELSMSTVEDEERILRELGIFAERIDISEEITLFEAHLKQFSEVISASSESVAKTLEFLLQEMNREVNTIGSKSSDLEVSRCVIEMKSTLEKIREIIQNVE